MEKPKKVNDRYKRMMIGNKLMVGYRILMYTIRHINEILKMSINIPMMGVCAFFIFPTFILKDIMITTNGNNERRDKKLVKANTSRIQPDVK